MRKYITLALLLFVASFVYFVPALHEKAAQMLSYSPCDMPLPYAIGSIDARFGLSKSEVLTDIQSATSLWSSAYGKNLFTYSPKAQLKVNFVYDTRQALDTQISELHTTLSQNNTTLTQQIEAYQADQAAFQQRLNAFQDTVNSYNAKGGAPQDVYDQLLKQQADLQAQGDALNVRARELNLSTKNYNAQVNSLNQDVAQFNAALAQKPEEGLFDGGNQEITIYFASNQQELLHTLAHEFGHALGMAHVADPKAIMYAYTTSSLVVTADDMQALRTVCREQPVLYYWIDTINIWFTQGLQRFRQG